MPYPQATGERAALNFVPKGAGWSAGALAGPFHQKLEADSALREPPPMTWRTRGYLPHRDAEGLVQHIVFNLADAFPSRRADNLDAQDKLGWADSELDAGHGTLLLADFGNAELVENCLLRDHGVRYALSAWCIMPNHVHVLAEQFPGHKLSSVIQTWKSVSAHAINKRQGRQGALWQREYFDRHMRNEEQFASTVNYIESNPVAAGLVDVPENWRFSSAWTGRASNDAGEGAGGPA